MGGFADGDLKTELENQARFYWDFYKGEKLSLNAEYRLVLDHSKDIAGGRIRRYRSC